MRIILAIGPTEAGTVRYRTIIRKKAALLEKHGIHSPDWNHIRLYLACADPDQVGLERFRRGIIQETAQSALRKEIDNKLEEAAENSAADQMLLANGQLGAMFSRRSEIERLRDLLQPHYDDIRIVIYVAEQARALAEHYTNRVLEGRRNSLEMELELAGTTGWWEGALALREENQPLFGLFNDVQFPPFWLDYTALIARWEEVFGKGNVVVRPLDLDLLHSEDGAQELNAVLGTDLEVGKLSPQSRPDLASGRSVARIRQFNDVLIRYQQARKLHLPRDIWRILSTELRVPGDPIAPGSLARISDHFSAENAALIERFPEIGPDALRPDPPQKQWQEEDPGDGFRATQYVAAFEYRINRNGVPASKDSIRTNVNGFGDAFAGKLPPGLDVDVLEKAEGKLEEIMHSPMRPHNSLGQVVEDKTAPAFDAIPPRQLPVGSSGNVIVGCMKNEAPYILEWIAYHRAIGVDNFLIYTNGCEDGTDEILTRLQQMGVVQHRLNDDWRGNSPQQHALNQSLNEPLIKAAEWIIHIDVDEFINIRTGNGTLADLFAAVPGATNVAMTWRLFGHNGVSRLADRFVIEQFDTCAPKFCPKPHTVWGFKTMFRNIGAYGKISCHRPNKLDRSFSDVVKWVNGSGADITRDTAERGWRNSRSTIGYDLVQLNHYALRSAESFLIKRQRGRALHVDRSIGLNYWIRMDWSDCTDVTIKRNLPRLREEYDRLMQDDELRAQHQKGLDWHRAKAEELHGTDEFEELFQQALNVKLNETERVAYSLALDMES